jgi:predicted MFS family arabinose efflux permease
MMSEATNGEAATSGSNRGGAPSPMTAGEWLLLLLLAAVQFTHIVDFMIIMPLGPVYIHEMGLSPWQFGSVVAAYTVSAGLAGLRAARFLDRFDRKSALLVLYAGFTAGTLLCAVAQDYLPLLAARTVAGAFGGVAAAVVLAIVGDAFPDARRGFAMGVVMTAFSVASIAGVPLGLHLADEFGWQTPFAILGGLSAAVLVLAAIVLPPLRGHLRGGPAPAVSTWAILAEPNHLWAFALTVTLALSTFTLAPYLATYLVANVGLQQEELKFMYLCGGLATLVTLTLFGRLADRFGKLPIFRILALVTAVPIVLATNLPAGLALPLVLIVTTLFMVASSGRMVPAMALITGCAAPADRGGFMSLNAGVQQLACGLAAALGGLLLRQEDDGALTGFALIGLLCCAATLVSLVLAGRLRPAPGGELAPDRAAVAGELSSAKDGDREPVYVSRSPQANRDVVAGRRGRET